MNKQKINERILNIFSNNNLQHVWNMYCYNILWDLLINSKFYMYFFNATCLLLWGQSEMLGLTPLIFIIWPNSRFQQKPCWVIFVIPGPNLWVYIHTWQKICPYALYLSTFSPRTRHLNVLWLLNEETRILSPS